jgi:hypothetical protein
MKNGLVYKNGTSFSCLPFTDIKEYKPPIAVDWEDDEYEIGPMPSPLYIIDIKMKREPVLVDFNQIESIVFDPSHTVNSVTEYALIERIDDVPLVVPAASILLEESNIHMYNGLYMNYHFEIILNNEPAVPFKRMKSMEVIKVARASERSMDRRRRTTVTVTKRNMETVSDEMLGWYALTALARKGFMRLDFSQIKKVTFM